MVFVNMNLLIYVIEMLLESLAISLTKYIPSTIC